MNIVIDPTLAPGATFFTFVFLACWDSFNVVNYAFQPDHNAPPVLILLALEDERKCFLRGPIKTVFFFFKTDEDRSRTG